MPVHKKGGMEGAKQVKEKADEAYNAQISSTSQYIPALRYKNQRE